ncbi:MAG: hypothetical protein IPL94_08955 [Tetrasphaera sp.]|nr:hypothetical protein [Tetrasphaera sp.]
MATAYRLRSGDQGPRQQSQVTCGSACLTVARMLVDPVFASWVRTGAPMPPGAPRGRTPDERFAAYERIVQRRTNGLLAGGGRLNAPWPRLLGTPPWGARLELEYGASASATSYDIELLRTDSEPALQASYDRLVDVVAAGAPGLLYVGNAMLPRHVVLILPGDGDRTLDVYDPGDGRVSHLRRDDFVGRRLALSAWDVPWISVQPSGSQTARSRSYAVDLDPAPA